MKRHPDSGEEVPVITHKDVALYPLVGDVNDRKIMFKFEHDPEIFRFSGEAEEEFKWGGMSGSLVYRLDESENLFKPCGIMYAARDGLDTLFFATHLDFIKDDGSMSGPSEPTPAVPVR